MHDIDRALFEMEQESNDEMQQGELPEGREFELVGELLEVSNEAELDRFLGDVFAGAVRAGNAFVKSGTGRALGGLLKKAAKRALPQIGRVLGDYFVPGAGGNLGSQAGSALGSALGLELEGLSNEDREMEVYRAFVQFADKAAKTAASAPASMSPTVAASRAATLAAQRHMPGLVPLIRRLTPPGQPRMPNGQQSTSNGQPFTPTSQRSRNPAGPRPKTGTWVRRGTSIVLLNA